MKIVVATGGTVGVDIIKQAREEADRATEVVDRLTQRVQVTGNREDGTALANLLEVLDQLGLINDQTT